MNVHRHVICKIKYISSFLFCIGQENTGQSYWFVSRWGNNAIYGIYIEGKPVDFITVYRRFQFSWCDIRVLTCVWLSVDIEQFCEIAIFRYRFCSNELINIKELNSKCQKQNYNKKKHCFDIKPLNTEMVTTTDDDWILFSDMGH